MILTIGNVKGGVGKTTLAINFCIALAARNKEVLLIDGDEQQTAMQFTELRASTMEGNCGYTSVSLYGAAIFTQMKSLKKNYDDIVIDVGGRDTGSLRAAMTISDTLLIPVQPRSFDVWSAGQTASMVEEVTSTANPDLVTLCVINCADTSGADNAGASQILAAMKGIDAVIEPTMVRRKSFPNAASAGKGIVEWKDEKAKKEFREVFKTVLAFKRK